ncbi:MAG: carbamate kinase [Pyrodictiaceae archaeon]
MQDILVIALGGNAFLRKGERGTVEEQFRNVRIAARTIVDVYEEGYRIVVTHGNGPQVGNILEWMNALRDKIPPLTMDIANAMTQGWLGYMLQQAIGDELERRGGKRRVVSLVTQVLVDPTDEAFRNPTKYVGPYYSKEEAERLSAETGWIFKEDPRGGYRRVVPSPKPLSIVEIDAIKSLLSDDYIVIAVGGGGIPVCRDGASLRGVEAVIDKDLASAVLAIELKASKLVILTDVEGVYINYGKPNQKLLRRIRLPGLRKYYEEGQFPPGSMGPKVEAAMLFLENGGKEAVIGKLEEGLEVVRGEKGTVILP